MKYLLFFHMRLQESNELLLGRLVLTENGKFADAYIATSGCVKHQHKSSQDDSGLGSIPSSYELKSINYFVDTKPINMAGTKGVQGNFYKISPHTVTIWGRTRGDFGIHRDANVPGSAGCIVLTTPTGWQAFQGQMDIISKLGISQIPLVVSYS